MEKIEHITRKGYHRKAYTREDGTKVAATYVPPTKIIKRGLSHGKQGLIPLYKDTRHMRKFRYKVNSPSAERQAAIREAAHEYGPHWVLHRLLAVHNVNPQIPSHEKTRTTLERDIRYARGLVANENKKK